MDLKLMLLQTLFLVGCSGYEVMHSTDPNTPSPVVPDIPPVSTPSASWSGSGPLTLQRLAGTWVMPCLSGQTIVLQFSGDGTAKLSSFRFVKMDCTGSISQSGAVTYSVFIGAPDSILGDGYQIDLIGHGNAYQVIKISSDNKLISLGANYGFNDASSPGRRPAVWHPISMVKD